jgi:hypothetical protein
VETYFRALLKRQGIVAEGINSTRLPRILESKGLSRLYTQRDRAVMNAVLSLAGIQSQSKRRALQDIREKAAGKTRTLSCEDMIFVREFIKQVSRQKILTTAELKHLQEALGDWISTRSFIQELARQL